MSLMKKTKAGTIIANTWGRRGSFDDKTGDAGITVALYGTTPVVSVECQGDELVLLVNDEAAERSGFKVRHTNLKWQVK